MSTSRFLKGAMAGIDLAIAASEFSEYIYDGDSFVTFDNDTNEAEGGYIITGQGTETVELTALLPGIALTCGTEGSGTTDSFFMTRQLAVGAFDITIGSGRRVAYETRFRVNHADEIGLFLGLCQAATVTEDTLLADDTGILGNFDTIGYHALISASEVVVQGVSRIAGGATQTGAAEMTTDELDLFNTYGFRFDGNKTIEWYLNNESFAKQTIAAATFATGESFLPTWSVKGGEAAVKSIKIDYWVIVEDLLASDRPE